MSTDLLFHSVPSVQDGKSETGSFKRISAQCRRWKANEGLSKDKFVPFSLRCLTFRHSRVSSIELEVYLQWNNSWKINWSSYRIVSRRRDVSRWQKSCLTACLCKIFLFVHGKRITPPLSGDKSPNCREFVSFSCADLARFAPQSSEGRKEGRRTSFSFLR